MNRIKIVLFDLGNVLVRIDFASFWQELGFQRPEEIMQYTDGYKSLTNRYENGNMSTDIYLHGLKSLFNNRFSTDQIERAFGSIIKAPVEGMNEIVERVSFVYDTALVSNTNEIHYNIFSRLDMIRKIGKHYLSHLLHVMKPERGFYDAIIKDQKLYPSAMLFIDDIAENVKAAKYAGMNAIRFEGKDKFKETLVESGIIEKY